MRSPFVVVLAASLLALSCGDDETIVPQAVADTGAVGVDTTDGDAADGDAADRDATGGDATDRDATDVPVDVAIDATTGTITFRLTNANPGGLSRWVQVVDGRGTPAWFNVMQIGSLDEFLRIHSTCTVCGCDDRACTPCQPQPDILEIAPGESVSAQWDGALYEIDTQDFCQNTLENTATEFQVEFVWSPEPPTADGTLPVGTLSRTRVRFELGVDAEATYSIERLAEQ